MKTLFTIPFMEVNSGLYSKEELYKCSFMKGVNQVTLQSILESEIYLEDKYWFVIKKTSLTNKQMQKIAEGVAKIVLMAFEQKYPQNNHLRDSYQAQRGYNENIVRADEAFEASQDGDIDEEAAKTYCAIASIYYAGAAAAASTDSSAYFPDTDMNGAVMSDTYLTVAMALLVASATVLLEFLISFVEAESPRNETD